MSKKLLFGFTVALVSISIFLPIVASLFDEPLLKFAPLAVLIILNLALLRHIKIEIDTFFFVVILSLFSSLNFWFENVNHQLSVPSKLVLKNPQATQFLQPAIRIQQVPFRYQSERSRLFLQAD